MIELLLKGNFSIAGNVAAGSLFSSLQSVGAGAGVGVAVKAVGGALGAGGLENISNFGFGSFGVVSYILYFVVDCLEFFCFFSACGNFR